jgi:hypothetical protein
MTDRTGKEQHMKGKVLVVGIAAALAVPSAAAAGNVSAQVRPQVTAQVVRTQVVTAQVVKAQVVKAQVVKAQVVKAQRATAARVTAQRMTGSRISLLRRAR